MQVIHIADPTSPYRTNCRKFWSNNESDGYARVGDIADATCAHCLEVAIEDAQTMLDIGIKRLRALPEEENK